jgi:starvation-inducible outer membrane lipoprotein
MLLVIAAMLNQTGCAAVPKGINKHTLDCRSLDWPAERHCAYWI